MHTRERHTKSTGSKHTTWGSWILWIAQLKLRCLFQEKTKIIFTRVNETLWLLESRPAPLSLHKYYFWSYEKSTHFLNVIGGETVWDHQLPSVITHFNQVCIIQLWKMLHIPAKSPWRSWTDCCWPAAGVSSLARSHYRLVHTREKNKVSTQPLNEWAEMNKQTEP